MNRVARRSMMPYWESDMVSAWDKLKHGIKKNAHDLFELKDWIESMKATRIIETTLQKSVLGHEEYMQIAVALWVMRDLMMELRFGHLRFGRKSNEANIECWDSYLDVINTLRVCAETEHHEDVGEKIAMLNQIISSGLTEQPLLEV